MIEPSTSPAIFRTKSELVYGQLREWVLSGHLAPGQRLDQDWLADELSVSRMPLRAALLRLEGEGLIRSEPYRGATVSPVSLEELEDVYASRHALETMLAEVAATKWDADVLPALVANVDEQQQAVEDRDFLRFTALDRDFHASIYRLSNYHHGCQVVDRLRDISERYVRIYAASEGGAEASVREHHQLLTALSAGDGSASAAVVRQHLERGLGVLTRMIAGRNLAAINEEAPNRKRQLDE